MRETERGRPARWPVRSSELRAFAAFRVLSQPSPFVVTAVGDRREYRDRIRREGEQRQYGVATGAHYPRRESEDGAGETGDADTGDQQT